MVARHDHDRVVGLAALLEHVEQHRDLGVEGLDPRGVVEHVAADDLVVGPVAWHAVDVGWPLAGGEACVAGVGPVRIVAAKPEERRLV